MSHIWTIFKRELKAYFTTPLAYVFIVIFLLLNGVFTFYFGRFYQMGQADLQSFFVFHPWLYLFLIPALGMRLWAEERKTGTIELLLTLPVSMGEAVIGKYLAAWAFTGIALALTFPFWITVNYLGSPDNGVIVAAYAGSFLMAGAYMAIGSCISATTRNQVIAFVVTVVVCFGFVMADLDWLLAIVSSWMPDALVDVITSFSFRQRFDNMMKGVIDLRDVVYFLSLIGCWLFANSIVLEIKKAKT